MNLLFLKLYKLRMIPSLYLLVGYLDDEKYLEPTYIPTVLSIIKNNQSIQFT
jgi:hypothetical protein